MSLPASITPATLDTLLGRLALLFLTGALGDLTVARHAAAQMLAAYHAETNDEVSLAAEIISFGLHALEALSQAADPDLPLNQKLRLRGSAVSLSREGHKAQRKLDQLQRARRTRQPAEATPEMPTRQPASAPARPGIDNALSLIESAREVIETSGKNGGQSWTKSFQQRQAAKRITENLKKKQAQHASRAAQSHPPVTTALPRQATA